MNSEHRDKGKPPLFWAGFGVMIFDVVSATMFTMRQLKESGLGHTYYEYIIGGVICAVIGFAFIAFMARDNTR